MSLKVMKFQAAWCQPCVMLQPTWDKIKDEVVGVEFQAVDIDKEQELASQYGVMSIPTILFMKDNVVVNKLVGLHTEEVIRESIDELMAEDE